MAGWDRFAGEWFGGGVGLGGERNKGRWSRWNLRRDACPTSNQGDVVMLVRLPRILGDRSLEFQPLIGLHVMQMLAHGTVRIPLDHEIEIALCILVADGRIRPYDRLLHLRALVLCQQRRGDGEARDVVAVGEREAEFLRVVVEFLDGFELEVDEPLVPAREGLLRSGC